MHGKIAVILAVLLVNSSAQVPANMSPAECLPHSGAHMWIGGIPEGITESGESGNAPDADKNMEPREPGTPMETKGPATPETPKEPQEPSGPEEPANPETPEETGKPSGPEEPANPANPETPEETGKPPGPEEPTNTTTPETPEETGKPSAPGEPGDKEEPAKTEEPIQAGVPTDTAEPAGKGQPGDAAPLGGAEGGVAEETAQLSPEEMNCIYKVSFPANTAAYFDPDNLSGRGQIYSKQYTVENHGNTDIAVKIKNISVSYHSAEALYELAGEETGNSPSNVKKLYISMVWVNEAEQTEKVLRIMEGSPDEEVLLLRAAEYDEQGEFVSLKEGGTGAFYFTGTLDASPGASWEEGEITVQFDYEIVNAQSRGREKTASALGQGADGLGDGISSGTKENQDGDPSRPEGKEVMENKGTEESMLPEEAATGLEEGKGKETLSGEGREEMQDGLPDEGDKEAGGING